MPPGAPRLLSPRLPGLRRGPGESAAPRCLRRWLMGHAAPARLPRSAARADSEPGPGPRPRTPVPSDSHDQLPPGTCRAQGAAAMLHRSRDSAAASAFRLKDPPLPSHAPTQAHRGLATPPRPHLLLSHSRLPFPPSVPLSESGLRPDGWGGHPLLLTSRRW